MPLHAPSGRENDTLYCHTLIKMMQLVSKAKTQLSSTRALRQSNERLMKTVCKLRKDLAEFNSSMQDKICLDKPLDASRLPQGLNLLQAQSLQSHYFCLLLDIHTSLTYPWLGISAHLADDPAATSLVEASCNEVAQASRSAILATRQTHLDGRCSAL